MRTALIALVAMALGACLTVTAPPAGRAVAPPAGQALVFGAIRMVDEKEVAYAPAWWDPWNEPFFGPGPRLTLELRRLQPPGGAVVYRSQPAPPVEEGGAFYWLLPPGEYVLAGNPRLYGSKRFTTAETRTLARFTIPREGASIYVGALVLVIRYDLVDLATAWKRGEAEYGIVATRVADEQAGAERRLRARYPSVPELLQVELMRAE